MFASMVQLTHRNTRRYGGYIVHFGVVVVIIGFAGSAFNQDKESDKGLAYGDKMTIGSYTLVCRSYTEEENANYGSEWAIIDVYKNGRQIDTMYPERRFYKASRQAQTIPTIRSTLKEDLYLVYEGQNEKSQPIIKAHLNPLVMWIWLGVWIILGGTVLALVPNAPAPVRVPAAKLVGQAIPVATGD
jgi:cytochrome c-type biogenesis protein CcmF